MEYSPVILAKGITDRNWNNCERGQTYMIVLMNIEIIRGDSEKGKNADHHQKNKIHNISIVNVTLNCLIYPSPRTDGSLFDIAYFPA